MRILIITLLLVSAAFAGAFEDNFDKNAGAGAFPQQFYDDIREHDGNYQNILKNYDDVPLQRLDKSDIPKDAVENDPQQQQKGTALGHSLSGKVSKENSLLSILKNVKSGGELTTLGNTYVCNYDNVTYSDYYDCRNRCQTVCGEYKFNVEFGCQYPEEILRVSVPDMDKLSPAPRFHFTYKGSKYITPPATAVCVNGMKSGKVFYTWNIEGDVVNLAIPDRPADVGECYDMTQKPFLAHYQEYYKYMGYAVQAYLANLGYLPSHSTESSTDLVFSAIVTGACDGGVPMTTLPNAADIKAIGAGNKPANIQSVADADPLYKMATESTDYSAYTCAQNTAVTLSTESKQTTELQVFTGALPDVTRKDKGSTKAFNTGTTIGISQDSTYVEDFTSRLEGRYITSSLVLGAYINSNGEVWENSTPILSGDVRHLENRWINSPVPYTFTVTIEKTVSEEKFSVSETDSCSVPKDCKLNAEYICNMDGNGCVQTVKNGIKTNEKVPKMCSEIGTAQDRYLVCTDGQTVTATGGKNTYSASGGYFTTKKEYACSTEKEKEDYSAFLAQSQLVASSATLSPTGDYSFKSIGIDGKQGEFTTNITLTESKCIQSCKVKVPANYDNKTVALPSGTSATPSPVLETLYYKPCTYRDKDDKWECVLDIGERLVAGGDCSCPNDFVDMIVNMKFVSEAASSMICSDK